MRRSSFRMASNIWSLLIFVSGCAVATAEFEVCKSVTGTKVIENLTSSFKFTMLDEHESTNSSWYDAKLSFHWDVADGVDYDGLIYQFIDLEKESSIPIPGGMLGLDTCKDVNATIWVVNESGNSDTCTLPCAQHMPPPCYFSSLCRQLSQNFTSLRKDVRSLFFTAKLGARYRLRLFVYKDWTAWSSISLQPEPIFCLHELISVMGFDPDEAKELCKDDHGKISGTTGSGPPVEIQDCVPEEDFDNGNMAKCVFRWRPPHDLAPGAILTGFAIYCSGGEVVTPHITADSGIPDENETVWYNVTVSRILFEKPYILKITPVVALGQKPNIFGTERKKEFIIKDVDACLNYSSTDGYCDKNANCTDLSFFDDVPALCSCHVGYVGNGVNNQWESGNGCVDFDSCSENQTCDPNAICVDSAPPYYNSSCYCPDGFIGDGYRSGSGCRPKSLIVALAVGIPVAAIAVILVTFMVWKARAVKRRKIEKKMSKFFSNEGAVYSTSSRVKNVIRNEHVSSGVFGERWELDRESIELKGILGRGNFGVVQMGILNANEQPKRVAIKMTAENSSEALRTAFLAEISMICSMGEHENLIGMVGCCTTGTAPIYLVSEFVKYGDLLHFLWDAREASKRAEDLIYNLTEADVHKIGKQVASGMQYLADIKIIHGDLAARNILVGEGLQCKISDFGLANDVYRYGMIKGASEKTVPLRWISPERMMAGKIPVTWRSDVWSFGILMYESITLGASPYPGIPQKDIFERLEAQYRMPRPSSCSQRLYDLMLKCWEWTPSRRPSFKDIMAHMDSFLEKKDPTYVNLVTMVPTLEDQQENVGEGTSLLQNDAANDADESVQPQNQDPGTSLRVENDFGETEA